LTTRQGDFEKLVIEQLSEYKRLSGRIKVLEQTPIGNGMYLNSSNGEDKLQDLHRKLKGMPSHMYLTKSEQEIEIIAGAYLTKLSTGTKSQLRDVKGTSAVDEEDHKLLKELTKKIEKVIEVRNGNASGIDGVIARLSEMQDLQKKLDYIDSVFAALDEYKPSYTKLLKLRYIDKIPVDDIADALHISRKTYDRWRPNAIDEYARLSGM
jgi:hypothetical protein